MSPQRMGLAHTSIAPYGVFKTKDGADILISIQSDREWRVLAEEVLEDKALAANPDFASNVERIKRRRETDARVAAVFAATEEATLTDRLTAADIAFARVNAGSACATSALAAHRGRHFVGLGVMPRSCRALPARARLMAECRRWASTAGFVPSSC